MFTLPVERKAQIMYRLISAKLTSSVQPKLSNLGLLFLQIQSKLSNLIIYKLINLIFLCGVTYYEYVIAISIENRLSQGQFGKQSQIKFQHIDI